MIEAALGRLGAMKGDLLGPGVYEALLEAPAGRTSPRRGPAPELDRARKVLRSTCYAPAERRTERDPSPAPLERALWEEVLAAWGRLVKFLDGTPHECARILAGSFDVANIRLAVRRILAGLGPEEGAPPWNLGGLSAIDRDKLRFASTMDEVADSVKGTPLERAFERAANRFGLRADRPAAGGSLFVFEQTLEAGYREAVAGAAGAVWGSVGRSARGYVARRELYTNVRWALRLRFARGYTVDEARQFLPEPMPGPECSLFQKVLGAETPRDALRTLAPLLASDVQNNVPARTTPREIDRVLRVALARWTRKELRTRFLQFASVLAYYDVRSQEVRDIVAIITARRQGRAPDEIRKYLGLVA